jgi:hypothetical protein
MRKGQILYIPAYWWYSIEFGKGASLATFKYKTYMNTVAILPQLVMKLLQTQNVKRNTIATVSTKITEQPKAQESASLVLASLGSASLAPTASLVPPTSLGPEPLNSPFNGENTLLPTTALDTTAL